MASGHGVPKPDKAGHPNRRVDRASRAPVCGWCGGTGEDTSFGGETNTCQSCGGGGGVETTQRRA